MAASSARTRAYTAKGGPERQVTLRRERHNRSAVAVTDRSIQMEPERVAARRHHVFCLLREAAAACRRWKDHDSAYPANASGNRPMNGYGGQRYAEQRDNAHCCRCGCYGEATGVRLAKRVASTAVLPMRWSEWRPFAWPRVKESASRGGTRALARTRRMLMPVQIEVVRARNSAGQGEDTKEAEKRQKGEVARRAAGEVAHRQVAGRRGGRKRQAGSRRKQEK